MNINFIRHRRMLWHLGRITVLCFPLKIALFKFIDFIASWRWEPWTFLNINICDFWQTFVFFYRNISDFWQFGGGEQTTLFWVGTNQRVGRLWTIKQSYFFVGLTWPPHWSHMCDSTQASLCPGLHGNILYHSMWIEWSLFQNLNISDPKYDLWPWYVTLDIDQMT